MTGSGLFRKSDRGAFLGGRVADAGLMRKRFGRADVDSPQTQAIRLLTVRLSDSALRQTQTIEKSGETHWVFVCVRHSTSEIDKNLVRFEIEKTSQTEIGSEIRSKRMCLIWTL
jgi:hypothetical protein